MFWQTYLLLAAFVPIVSYAGVVPNRQQAHDDAPLPSGNPSKRCSVDCHSDPFNRICPSGLSTQAIPFSVAKRSRQQGECNPLGFFAGKTSRWCPAGQYCDPFQSVCKPQLASRALPAHAEHLSISEFQTSLSHSEDPPELTNKDWLATIGCQPCPSRRTTPRRRLTGQCCQPLSQVCRPLARVRTQEPVVGNPVPAMSNMRECDPLAFLSKWCSDDQDWDIIEYVCRSQLPPRAEPATEAVLFSGIESPLPETGRSRAEQVVVHSKRDSSVYSGDQSILPERKSVAGYDERELPPYDQRECYPFGDFGGPEKWCPADQYCDDTEYVCRPWPGVVQMARMTSSLRSVAQRISLGNADKPVDNSGRRLLANDSESELLLPKKHERSSQMPHLSRHPDGQSKKRCPSGQECTLPEFVSSFDFPMLALVTGSGSIPGPSPAPQHSNPGIFRVVGPSGVPAMHAALMPNGRVVFLDKVEDYSPLNRADGRLAFSSEFDPATSQVVPLAYKTNAFCSAGAFLADGRVISVGGNAPLPYLDPTVSDGFDGIRYLERSATDRTLDGRSWSEPGNKLASKRWYASAQTMPDGSIFVASGSLTGLVITDNANNNPTYEILDANAIAMGRNVAMNILVKNQPYYLYPFLHLLRDGSLFVFTSNSSQIFQVGDNRIAKEMPDLVGEYRTYPNSGGSVMLPLTSQTGYAADVIICGGGAYVDVTSPTEASCGRIQPESDVPTWEMDSMPEGRVMVEGILLPDGTVLWLNGAQIGAQGFGLADDPALEALIYDPEPVLGQRWSVAGRSEIPRLYHSVAVLLLDGTVLVAGGNPNEQPVLPQDINPDIITQKYPTEYRVEIYTPPYLMGENSGRRPQNIVISTDRLRADGSIFEVTFTAPQGGQHGKVVLSHGGFVTHGLHMGQRMVVLDHEGGAGEGEEKSLQVHMPEMSLGSNVLPPGPYVLYVVVDGVPSIGQFVMVE